MNGRKHYNTTPTCTYDLTGEYGIGYDSKKNCFYFDLEDYEKIKNYSWLRSKKNYMTAYNKETRHMLLLHHLVLDYDKDCGLIPDHTNRVRWDNRKENLRLVSYVQNCINVSRQSNNKSGYIGVTWDQCVKKWQATIRVNRKLINLGRRKDLKDALILRLKAEKKYFGEFAPQRHLFDEYNI